MPTVNNLNYQEKSNLNYQWKSNLNYQEERKCFVQAVKTLEAKSVWHVVELELL